MLTSEERQLQKKGHVKVNYIRRRGTALRNAGERVNTLEVAIVGNVRLSKDGIRAPEPKLYDRKVAIYGGKIYKEATRARLNTKRY